VQARPPSCAAPAKKLQGEALERAITKLLRHTAEKQGLTVRPDGYVEVQRILELDFFHGVSVEEFLGAAIESQITTKRRHQVMEENGALLVRAVQGHTIAAVRPDALMQEITDPDEVPICIHGTYEKAFEKIQQSDLNRMSRNEIQMSVGLPQDPDVTSGVRPSVEVLIYIDVARAMGQGLRFFRSANNVICSPGPIPPSCFAHVVRRSTVAALQAPAFNRSAGTASAPATAAQAAARPASPADVGQRRQLSVAQTARGQRTTRGQQETIATSKPVGGLHPALRGKASFKKSLRNGLWANFKA